jgi:hypothetical protein
MCKYREEMSVATATACFYQILLRKSCKQLGSQFALYELIFKDSILN